LLPPPPPIAAYDVIAADETPGIAAAVDPACVGGCGPAPCGWSPAASGARLSTAARLEAGADPLQRDGAADQKAGADQQQQRQRTSPVIRRQRTDRTRPLVAPRFAASRPLRPASPPSRGAGTTRPGCGERQPIERPAPPD
jgi:hypothetical protein